MDISFIADHNKNNNEWWGFSRKHGWVILDRNLFSNTPGGSENSELIFSACECWTVYEEPRRFWKQPDYIYALSYLKSLGVDDHNAAVVKLEKYLIF